MWVAGVRIPTHSNTIALEGSVSMSIYSIYKITNKINGKNYIGYTANWLERKKEHIRCAKKGSKFLLHCAIRKYGEDSFEWELICQSKDSYHLLNEMEPYFIKEYNSFYLTGHGYNMTWGGEGTRGPKTEEHKRKIQASNKGQIPWHKGKHLSEEHKRNLSLSKIGRKFSDEHRRKLSEARKGKSPWNKGLKFK